MSSQTTMRKNNRTLFTPTWWFLLAVTLLVSGVTARLGLWQRDRALQKESVFAEQALQAQRPSLGTEQLLQFSREEQDLYRTVSLKGRWLDQYTVYLENRIMNRSSGFFVLTPLELAPGVAAWVQRGWVARDPIRPDALPEVTTPSEMVYVHGMWVPPPSVMVELADTAPDPKVEFARRRANVYWDGIQKETGLRFVATVLETGPSSGGLQRNWASPISGADKNWGYSFQWFALSTLCVGLFIWFQVLKKRSQHG